MTNTEMANAFGNFGAWVVAGESTEPVPEPATIVLLGAGLLGLGGSVRRNRRKNKTA